MIWPNEYEHLYVFSILQIIKNLEMFCNKDINMPLVIRFTRADNQMPTQCGQNGPCQVTSSVRIHFCRS